MWFVFNLMNCKFSSPACCTLYWNSYNTQPYETLEISISALLTMPVTETGWLCWTVFCWLIDCSGSLQTLALIFLNKNMDDEWHVQLKCISFPIKMPNYYKGSYVVLNFTKQDSSSWPLQVRNLTTPFPSASNRN